MQPKLLTKLKMEKEPTSLSVSKLERGTKVRLRYTAAACLENPIEQWHIGQEFEGLVVGGVSNVSGIEFEDDQAWACALHDITDETLETWEVELA